jgi:hypothetical protein
MNMKRLHERMRQIEALVDDINAEIVYQRLTLNNTPNSNPEDNVHPCPIFNCRGWLVLRDTIFHKYDGPFYDYKCSMSHDTVEPCPVGDFRPVYESDYAHINE